MRGLVHGDTPTIHCAPCHTAQHGRGAGRGAHQIDATSILSHALINTAALGRLFAFSLLSLQGLSMSADSKLDVFPGEKALSSEVLEWTRVNKPRLSADHRALAEGYQPRSLLA